MLTGDLSEVLEGILSDYSKFSIVNLLDESANILSQRSGMGENQYLQYVGKFRQRAEQILRGHSLKDRAPEIISMLQLSSYSNVLPVNIARKVLASLPLDAALGAASSEVIQFSAAVGRAQTDFSKFVAVSHSMNQHHYGVPEGGIKIKLRLPESRFESDLGILGGKIEKFDRFFASVAALGHPDKEKPKILSVSTGSFSADLVAYASVAIFIMDAYLKIVTCAIQTIELAKAAKLLRDNGLPSPPINLDQATDKLIEKAFEGHFAQISAGADPEQENGLIVKVKTSAKFLVQEVRGGTRISFDIETAKQFSDSIETNSDIDPNEVAELIEKANDLQLSLDRRISELDPIYQIEGPEEDGLPVFTEA